MPDEPGVDKFLNEGQLSKNVPVALMQAIYHQITGKTEVLRKDYKEARLVRRTDIEQLCIRIHQTCAQFNVIADNTAISVRHMHSFTQKMSSLEKFTQYDDNTPDPIDNITIQHSTLIKVPATEKHYEYKIEMVIESTEIARNGKADKIPSFLMSIFEFDTFRIKIDYVDYIVARTFLNVFDEWIKGLEINETNALLLRLKSLIPPMNAVDPLRRVSNTLSTGVALFAIYQIKDRIISQADYTSFATFGIVAATIFFFTRACANIAYASFCERLLRYQKPNLILINRGDRENYERFKTNRKSVYKVSIIYLLELAVIVAVNVLSKKIYDFIK